MKKGDWIYLLRDITNPNQKPIIYRCIREVYEDSVLCDDNIEYKINQIVDECNLNSIIEKLKKDE